MQRDDLDFLVVHVEATDEASHEGDLDAKLQAVQRIDEHIVGPVHDWLQQQGDYRLLICPDHPTYLRTKTHSHGDCPFAACGSGIAVDTLTQYNEVAAAQSDLAFPKGHELMGWFQPSW
jgi:2,3-bisphosphoglycerate-independent phosphoglycerate mutase